MGNELSLRLVPDALWKIAEPLLPQFDPRPQGGGTAPLDKRAVFTAIVYVLTSGCAWRHLPPSFGVSVPTAHRRFTAWARTGLPRSIGRCWTGSAARRDRLVGGDPGRGERPGQKGGSLTGPSPVDRGKPGSKIHILSEAHGIPLVVGVSAANTHDSASCRRWSQRYRPSDPAADPAAASPTSSAPTRATTSTSTAWLRERGIVPRIARRGIEDPNRLGRHRWKIERTIAWLTGYRRLTIRYERHAEHFAAFLQLAAAITCYKKLTT